MSLCGGLLLKVATNFHGTQNTIFTSKNLLALLHFRIYYDNAMQYNVMIRVVSTDPYFLNCQLVKIFMEKRNASISGGFF